MNKRMLNAGALSIAAALALRPAFAGLPVTDGLLYDLDARQKDSAMTFDSNGYLTEWRSSEWDPSRAGELASVAFSQVTSVPNKDFTYVAPHYNADAFDGRGAVKFGYSMDEGETMSTPLRSNRQFSHRTVFLVVKNEKRPSSGWTVFWGAELNYSFGLSNDYAKNVLSDDTRCGGTIWANGEEVVSETKASWAYSLNTMYVLASEVSAEIAEGIGNCLMSLGSYSLNYLAYAPLNRHLIGDVAEFLAYDRVLTEEERTAVTDYLVKKWSFVSDAPVTDGLVCHLDANDSDTLRLDEKNRVMKWHSKSSNGFSLEYYGQDFKTFSVGDRPTLAPYWQEDGGYLGKPAVMIGTDVNDGETDVGSVLYASNGQQLTHRTCFFVTRLYKTGYRLSSTSLALWAQKESYLNSVEMTMNTNPQWSSDNSGLLNGGRAWLDGELAYDHETLTGNFGKADTPCLLVTEAASGKTFEPLLGGSYIQYWRYWRGPVSEILVYDRVLTESERKMVTTYLQEKWMGGATEVLWNGADGARWDEPANWVPAHVPGESARVDLMGGTVTVTANLKVQSVDNGTLAVDTDGTVLVEAAIGPSVSFVKKGTGALALPPFQAYEGTTTLESGTLVATNAVAVDSMPGLTLHLDASRADTLTLDEETGDVAEWRSTVGNVTFYPPATLPPERPVCDYTPWFDASAGLSGVRFGVTHDNVTTGSYLRTTSAIANRTLLIVNRQENQSSSAILGTIASTAGRITRSNTKQGCWDVSGASWVKVNGKEDEHFPSLEKPHLLVLERTADSSLAMSLGVAWAYDNNNLPRWDYVYNRTTIHEVIAFDRVLTEAEIAALQSWLMAKWSIEPQDVVSVRDTLSPNTQYVVTDDATLDFGGMAQTVSGVKLDAGAASAYPVLTFAGVPGALDLTGTSLTLLSETPVEKSQCLFDVPDAEVVGPLASVDGLDGQARITYRTHKVRYSTGGLTVLIK